MKRLFLVILAVTCLDACTPELPPLNIGSSRSEALDSAIPSRKDSIRISTPLPGSRAVWVTGVEYPPEYDWRTDLMMDEVKASIFLMLDGKKILSIPAGAGHKHSTDPDRHLFFRDAVYDCFYDGDSTYLYKNGAQTTSLKDDWVLKGLSTKDGRTLSLWTGQRGRKMVLMDDENKLMDKSDVTVTGNLTESPALPGGALYTSEGKICFGYILENSQYHLVRDGADEYVRIDKNAEKIHDVRVIGGKSCVAYEKYGKLFIRHGAEEYYMNVLETGDVDEVRLFEYAGQPFFVCLHRKGSELEYSTVWKKEGRLAIKLMRNHLYMDGERVNLIGQGINGGISIQNGNGRMTDVDVDSYMFSWRLACVHDGSCYLALTSRESGRPLLWIDGNSGEIPVNGFLTGVYVEDY